MFLNSIEIGASSCMVPYSYCMATVWYRYYCTAVWYCMAVQLYGTVWAIYYYSCRSSRILLLVDLVGILMPSAECMGLYRGGLLSNRSELDAMGGMPLGV